MNKMLEEVPYGGIMKLVADPSGKRKGMSDMRSLYDHYREYGVFFTDGNNRIDAGIAKVQAYFSLGRLKIFNTCVNTIREGINYKYKPQELMSEKNLDEKPIDKFNHSMDSLRYLINELSDNPDNLKTKAYAPGTRVKDTESHLPYALQSPKNNTYGKNDWYNSYY